MKNGSNDGPSLIGLVSVLNEIIHGKSQLCFREKVKAVKAGCCCLSSFFFFNAIRNIVDYPLNESM